MQSRVAASACRAASVKMWVPVRCYASMMANDALSHKCTACPWPAWMHVPKQDKHYPLTFTAQGEATMCPFATWACHR